jgi:ubiquinone/menaquinone biosynthesis C-methylase UbiE
VSDAQPDGEVAARTLSARLFRAMLATQESFIAYLGVRLGLYEALHCGGPATVPALAERTGLAPRYVREWLEQQAVAGLLAVDDPGAAWDARIYRLPPGHERVLIASDDPLSVVATAMLPVGGVAGALPDLLAAFRTGDGVPQDVFGEDWRQGHGGANRRMYTAELAGWLRRYLPDVAARLGSRARVADVGCGAGWASVALATAFPDIEVTGLDVDPAVVAQAAKRVTEAGLGDRVTFSVADAGRPPAANGFDLVCVFDALHELARPVEALQGCRAMCAPGGTVLVLDSRVADRFRTPGDEIERFQYATSVLHCLPAALVGADPVGTGTVMRAATVRAYAREAGFTSIRVFDLDDRFHRLYRLG